MGHLRRHSFTDNSDHVFSAITSGQYIRLNGAGTAIESSGVSGNLVTGTGTSNYVVKWDSSNSGLTNSQIFDNGTNVGVGTITPSTKFDIKGSRADSIGTTFNVQNSAGTNSFTVRDDGRIGIGTSPANGIDYRPSSAGYRIVYYDELGNQVVKYYLDSTGSEVQLLSSTSGLTHVFRSDSHSYILNNRFGIGTSNPLNKFHVNAGTDGLRVDTNEANYSLFIDSVGRIGMNDGSPGSKSAQLSVVGDAAYNLNAVVITGPGFTSGTNALKVLNSGGTQTFVVRDDGVLLSGTTPLQNIFTSSSNGITGSLTPTYIPLANGTHSITDSIISQNGTDVTVNGSVNIYGNVYVAGTASTFNTQTVQTADNNITMNLSGSHVSALYGGISVLSGRADNISSTWTIDSTGAWSANTPAYFTGLRTDSSGYTLRTYNSAGTNTFTVRDDGNIGIGTATPSALLQIKSTGSSPSNYSVRVEVQNGLVPYAFAISDESEVTVNGQAVNNIVAGLPNNIFQTYQGNYFFQHWANMLTFGGSGASDVKQFLAAQGSNYGAIGTYSTHDFRIRTDNQERVVVDTTGNVGIGTMFPSEKLTVVGNYSGTGTLTTNGQIFADNSAGNGFRMTDASYGAWGFSSPSNSTYTSGHLLITHYGIGPVWYISEDGKLGMGDFNAVAPSAQIHAKRAFSTGSVNQLKLEDTENGHIVIVDSNGKVGIGAGTSPAEKLHISGGTIRINDSTYGAGKLAVSDANGSISFSSTTALGLVTSASSVSRYTSTTTISDTGTVITHNLGTNYILCAFYDTSGNPVIPQYQRTSSNAISVTAATTGTYDIVIHG